MSVCARVHRHAIVHTRLLTRVCARMSTQRCVCVNSARVCEHTHAHARRRVCKVLARARADVA